jgi:hypothetical protein
MPLIARLCLGKGARCSCLAKYIRPSKDVSEALVNSEPGWRIDDLIAISRDVTTRGGKTFVSIFFRAALSLASSMLRSDGLRW